MLKLFGRKTILAISMGFVKILGFWSRIGLFKDSVTFRSLSSKTETPDVSVRMKSLSEMWKENNFSPELRLSRPSLAVRLSHAVLGCRAFRRSPSDRPDRPPRYRPAPPFPSIQLDRVVRWIRDRLFHHRNQHHRAVRVVRPGPCAATSHQPIRALLEVRALQVLREVLWGWRLYELINMCVTETTTFRLLKHKLALTIRLYRCIESIL